MPREKAKRAKGGRAKPAPVEQALTLAKVLGATDPKEQVMRAQQLIAIANTPVLTMVIQVDGRDPQGKVWVSNIGPAITGPVAHMMLAAAGREMAERMAEAEARAQADAQAKTAPPGSAGKAGK